MVHGTYGNQCLNCGFTVYSTHQALHGCKRCSGLELHVWLVPDVDAACVSWVDLPGLPTTNSRG